MMKHALFLAAVLAALCGPALAARQLTQSTIPLSVVVCSGDIYDKCCVNFLKTTGAKILNNTITGKPYPQAKVPGRVQCKFTTTSDVTIAVKPRDNPLNFKAIKADDKAIAAETAVSTNVTETVDFTFDLAKYDPPNNIWTSDKPADGYFCVCPTNPPAASP